jgi:hypothetical protein
MLRIRPLQLCALGWVHSQISPERGLRMAQPSHRDGTFYLARKHSDPPLRLCSEKTNYSHSDLDLHRSARRLSCDSVPLAPPSCHSRRFGTSWVGSSRSDSRTGAKGRLSPDYSRWRRPGSRGKNWRSRPRIGSSSTADSTWSRVPPSDIREAQMGYAAQSAAIRTDRRHVW